MVEIRRERILVVVLKNLKKLNAFSFFLYFTAKLLVLFFQAYKPLCPYRYSFTNISFYETYVEQPSPIPTTERLSVWSPSSSIDLALFAPPVRSLLLLSFTLPALSGSAPGRAAETRLHQFQMKHQHFLPLHQSTAPVHSPRSLTTLLLLCV